MNERREPRVYLNNATAGFPKSAVALSAVTAAVSTPPMDIRDTPLDYCSVERARSEAAKLLGVSNSVVSFTPDATTAMNFVLQGALASEDLCVTDNRAHNAVGRTLYHLGRSGRGVQRMELPLYDANDEIALRELDAIPNSARLVCLNYVSNVTGSVYPVDRCIARIRSVAPRALVLVDACQAAGAVDLTPALQADFVVFSGHKYLHALPGAAIFIARRPLRPILFGGTGRDSANLAMRSFGRNHIEVGTPNVPAIESLVAALREVVDGRSPGGVHGADTFIAALWEGLQRETSLEPLGRGPGGNRTAIVACRVTNGRRPSDYALHLWRRGIVVRAGLLCAPSQHDQLGLGDVGTLRISPSRFTRMSDIREALEEIATFERSAPEFEGERSHGDVDDGQDDYDCTDSAGVVTIVGQFEAPAEELCGLLPRLGWKTVQLSTDSKTMAVRAGLLMTVEPSGKFELSGSATLAGAQRELSRVKRVLRGQKL